jgi:hypothetical protein
MAKQMKISDLKRVVNVETISKYAMQLRNEENMDEEQIENILNELEKKTPSREILMKTRLGFILKDLAERESLSKDVRDKARALRLKWKEFHKRLLLAPKYDVKCDKPTTEGRERARKALKNAFTKSKDQTTTDVHEATINEVDLDSVIKEIEFKIFTFNDNLVNISYFDMIRKAVRCVGDIDQFSKLIKQEITLKEFLDNCFSNFDISST